MQKRGLVNDRECPYVVDALYAPDIVEDFVKAA